MKHTIRKLTFLILKVLISWQTLQKRTWQCSDGDLPLFQWGIISGNTRNWRKTDETGQGDAQIVYLLIKIFLRNWQVLFECIWNMKKVIHHAEVNNLFGFVYTKKNCNAQGSSKYYLFVIDLCFWILEGSIGTPFWILCRSN